MKKEYAILKVKLIETVPAYEYSRLLSVINDLYDNFLWIDFIRREGTIPYTYKPEESERLYILKAEIGTPNKVEFLGISTHLIDTSNYLSRNYNSLLELNKVSLLHLDHDSAMAKLLDTLKQSKAEAKQIELKQIKKRKQRSLEDELEELLESHQLDQDIHEEKMNFLKYLNILKLLTENIVNQADITIVKSGDGSKSIGEL